MASATSLTDACTAHRLPEITMFGLSSIPSSKTFLIEKCIETACRTPP